MFKWDCRTVSAPGSWRGLLSELELVQGLSGGELMRVVRGVFGEGHPASGSAGSGGVGSPDAPFRGYAYQPGTASAKALA
jgi:hypothetical protein